MSVNSKTVLVSGASGSLGGHLVSQLSDQGFAVVGLSSSPQLGTLTALDITDLQEVREFSDHHQFDQFIHCAARSAIGDCYNDPDTAHLVNVEGTKNLISCLKRSNPNLRSVYVSTDMVFSGDNPPYFESKEPHPLSVYGRTKLSGEGEFTLAGGDAIVRLPLMYGFSHSGKKTFFDSQYDSLRSGVPLNLFTDEWRTPVSYSLAASALIEICQSDYKGILHVGGNQRVSRYQFGRSLAKILGVDETLVVATTQQGMQFAEPRPRDLSFDTSLWRRLFPDAPNLSLEQALREVLK